MIGSMGVGMNYDYEGQVRRIDLYLRTKYPLLLTRIFKQSPVEFEIYVGSYFADFEAFVKEFNGSIKFVTVPVRVVNAIPATKTTEIASIPDSDIPSGFEGQPFTVFELINHVQASHPEIRVSTIGEDFKTRIFTVQLQGSVDTKIKDGVLSTISKYKFPMQVTVEDGGVEVARKYPDNPVFYINSSHDFSILELPFLRRDEQVWFDNLSGIYNGTFTKNDLFFYNAEEKSCFIDFSVFPNINIRNHLLLYDTIYCTLPLMGALGKFFDQQQITRKEFLYLVSRNRLKVLVTQPEIRHEYDFFRDIYHANPNSIASRRALAALCAVDIVSINKDYIFNEEEFVPFVGPLAHVLSELTKKDINSIIHLLLWPRIALRKSFDELDSASTKRLSNYGVNQTIINSFPEDVKKKYAFEFVVHSEAIHIAHALDATYFPFTPDASGYTDKPYAQTMGSLLNFYKCFKKDTLHEYFELNHKKEDGINLLEPVKIFDIDSYLSVDEFEKETANHFIRREFRSLFDELATLGEEERTKRIKEYNTSVEAYLKNNKFKNAAFDLGTEATGLPLLGFAKNMASLIYDKVKSSSGTIKKYAEKMEEVAAYNLTGKKKISLLTRLNRVARLKKDYNA
ncbi:MAG: hypothetical protein WC880_05175 [Candidatus Paceibacterota bacterium]